MVTSDQSGGRRGEHGGDVSNYAAWGAGSRARIGAILGASCDRGDPGSVVCVPDRPSRPPYVPSVAESIEEALASTRLEGLEPSPELIEDFERLAAGEIESEELIARTVARHKR